MSPKRTLGTRALVVLLIVMTLTVFLSAAALAATPEEELEKRQRELLEIQREIEEQKKDILSTKKQESAVTAELRRLQQQVELAEKDLRYAEAQTAVAEKQLRQTEIALEQAEADVELKTQMLNARVRALYDVGPVGYLEVLLGSTDFSDFLSRIDVISTIISQDVTQLRELSEARQAYTDTKADLEKRMQQLASLKTSRETKRTELSSRSADRSKYLSQIQKERQQMEQALDDLERTSEELVGIIQGLQEKSGVTVQQGGFKPAWPATGRISSYFGRRLHPVTKTYRNHTGIDIAIGMNTPVKAADAGVVIHASNTWLGGYGKTVIIDHGGGISTLYAHNNSVAVKVGQKVVKGQVVSYSGSTGVSTGPHLHFEVRVNGTPVDPMKYLK